jgi:hypothetical protein
VSVLRKMHDKVLELQKIARLLDTEVAYLHAKIHKHMLVCPEGTVQSGLQSWDEPFPGSDSWVAPRPKEDLGSSER